MNIKNKSMLNGIILVAGVMLLNGCASHREAVTYKDPGTAQSLTLNFEIAIA